MTVWRGIGSGRGDLWRVSGGLCSLEARLFVVCVMVGVTAFHGGLFKHHCYLLLHDQQQENM